MSLPKCRQLASTPITNHDCSKLPNRRSRALDNRPMDAYVCIPTGAMRHAGCAKPVDGSGYRCEPATATETPPTGQPRTVRLHRRPLSCANSTAPVHAAAAAGAANACLAVLSTNGGPGRCWAACLRARRERGGRGQSLPRRSCTRRPCWWSCAWPAREDQRAREREGGVSLWRLKTLNGPPLRSPLFPSPLHLSRACGWRA